MAGGRIDGARGRGAGNSFTVTRTPPRRRAKVRFSAVSSSSGSVLHSPDGERYNLGQHETAVIVLNTFANNFQIKPASINSFNRGKDGLEKFADLFSREKFFRLMGHPGLNKIAYKLKIPNGKNIKQHCIDEGVLDENGNPFDSENWSNDIDSSEVSLDANVVKNLYAINFAEYQPYLNSAADLAQEILQDDFEPKPQEVDQFRLLSERSMGYLQTFREKLLNIQKAFLKTSPDAASNAVIKQAHVGQSSDGEKVQDYAIFSRSNGNQGKSLHLYLLTEEQREALVNSKTKNIDVIIEKSFDTLVGKIDVIQKQLNIALDRLSSMIDTSMVVKPAQEEGPAAIEKTDVTKEIRQLPPEDRTPYQELQFRLSEKVKELLPRLGNKNLKVFVDNLMELSAEYQKQPRKLLTSLLTGLISIQQSFINEMEKKGKQAKDTELLKIPYLDAAIVRVSRMIFEKGYFSEATGRNLRNRLGNDPAIKRLNSSIT